ncbi:MAG: AAA family ATPase, partial [Deltaproteobacteria bacterium]|nr:AAA family ATPase [Deltaproteobacteria bacterium]
SMNDFRHFCLDEQTATTLLHVAHAVTMREACLLEGETSTAKTSTILYLAAQLDQPVVRVNLHGQTDTGELVGRYVPDKASGGWRWHEGHVLRAMRDGCWLLFDELNLAEPQILERFNSLLEREPSFVVSEHDGERIATADIHPNFRIFATMNPAEYAGRSSLSPAWRDRFRAHRIVPVPGEGEILAFLEQGVLGIEPGLFLSGKMWVPGRTVEAVWGGIAEATGIRPFLRALARFHVSLERSLASADGPGRGRRDRYVVTRRNLISVLDWLGAHGVTERTMREALVRYYLARIMPADQAHVIRLLDASGIGPTSWSLEEAPTGDLLTQLEEAAQ